jgi:Reverse transcriptase (RNA-dependent DNA polymerase)
MEPTNQLENDTLLVFDPASQKVVRLAAQDAEKHIPTQVITAIQLKRRARKGIPVYVVQINNIGIPIMDSGNDNQNAESEPELTSLLTEFSDDFPDDLPSGLPPERSIELKIYLVPEAKPIKRPIYKLSMEELNEVKRQIHDFLEKGFIRPSSIFPWGSSVLFVPKKDGGLRMCVDYRALNKSMIRNNYPLPRIDEVWDQIGGSKYTTSLDLRSGHNRIRIAKEDTEKTCLRTRYGAFKFLVVPFGLAGAPQIFQSLMNDVLRPYLDRFCLVYLDDILIYSKTREEHLEHIRLVFSQLRKHPLYAKLCKCAFMRSSLTYLGQNISKHGISIEERKIYASNSWERPQNVVNVQSILGLCIYYRRFVPQFARIAAPFTDLTKKTNPFSWSIT